MLTGTSGLTPGRCHCCAQWPGTSPHSHSASQNHGKPADGCVAAFPSSPRSAAVGDTRCGWAKRASPGTNDFFSWRCVPDFIFWWLAILVGVERLWPRHPCSSGSRAGCLFLGRLLGWRLSARRGPWRFLLASHKCAQCT